MVKWLVGAAVVFAVFWAVALRVVQVHDEYGQWGLTSDGPRLRVSALGRDYDRSDEISAAALPDGYERHGTTDDGDDVFAPLHLRRRDPVVIYVEDDESRVWTYELVGGP